MYTASNKPGIADVWNLLQCIDEGINGLVEIPNLVAYLWLPTYFLVVPGLS